MRFNSIFGLFFLIAAAFPAGQGLTAQGPNRAAKQTIRGMVVDHTGIIVPNFIVEITQRGTTITSSRPAITTRTDREGQFSATVEPGSYDVCVPHFPKSCRTVTIQPGGEEPEYLTLKVNPSEELHDLPLPDGRFRVVAGEAAENCGHVRLEESPRRSTKCAKRAFERHRPFYVIYDQACTDCDSAQGLARDSSGKLFSIVYDSMGIDSEHLPANASMPDGFHTIVAPCAEPVRVHVNWDGQLSCSAKRH